MAIIVISHQMGAGGPEIGTALAQRRRYGLAEEKLSHLEESKPTLFERFDTETRHHITVLQTTQFEFAEMDNAVLMRGGGQWLLRGVPHALRVRLVAPFEHRVKQWIKRTAEMTGETPNQRAAADFVRRDDAEKAGRMRYLYEVDIADPLLYELIINTEKLRHEAVVEILERLVRRPEMATTEEGRRIVGARLPRAGGARHARGHAPLPDQRGGAGRRGDPRGDDRARARGRGRAEGPGGARGPDAAGRDPADPALRRVIAPII